LSRDPGNVICTELIRGQVGPLPLKNATVNDTTREYDVMRIRGDVASAFDEYGNPPKMPVRSS
jgi:hypothetical protein